MNEEDFLKRWSRRKREAAEAVKPDQPVAESTAAGRTVAPEDSAASEANATSRQVEFDPATLPPIESITAVSDVTAFLRAGVPVELTRAALRRVWTTDPAIRDFVGLAENAWDFTDPTAMPGFGPLESTEQVRRMIAQVVDQIGKSAQSVAPDSGEVQPEVSEDIKDSNEINTGRGDGIAGQAAGSADEAKESHAQVLANQVLLQSNSGDAAVQRDTTEAEEKPQQFARRSHGGALPR
jgi:hypothetical protein